MGSCMCVFFSAAQPPAPLAATRPASVEGEVEYEGLFKKGSKCPVARLQRALASTGLVTLPARGGAPRLNLRCPQPVVMARAALAATPPVRALRPQALATRLAAVSLVAALSNAPLGVWRHHCEKFSPEWILAVHMSIPLVMCLRKAVLLPRYSVLFTITSAILGQAMGAAAERSRLGAAAAAADDGAGDATGDTPGDARVSRDVAVAA